VIVLAVLAVTIAAGAVVIASRVSPVSPLSAPQLTPTLPDASETGIELAATSRGLRCRAPGLHVGFGNPPAMHLCQGSPRGGLLSVQTIGPDDSHVSAVQVEALGLRPADEPAALALFQAVVGAAVAGPDAAADESWLRDHFDQTGTSRTTLNGVALQLTVSGSQRSLFVQPATP
jgi:hypothetical protein